MYPVSAPSSPLFDAAAAAAAAAALLAKVLPSYIVWTYNTDHIYIYIYIYISAYTFATIKEHAYSANPR